MSKYPLSEIRSEDALKQEIRHLKIHLEQQEKTLFNLANRAPGQIFKSATEAVVPAIINQTSLPGIWKMVKLLPVFKSLFSGIRKKTGI